VQYDEEGIPNFFDPVRNRDMLRVKTFLLRGPSAASQDSVGFLKETFRKTSGSDFVRLGQRNAVHWVERSDSTESHHWVIAEGPHIMLATCSVSSVEALRESKDLAAVISVLESVKFGSPK
jgi:hypothetical protein